MGSNTTTATTTTSSPRPRVFLDVSIGAQPAGRLTIELFTDRVPRTAENFRQLCTGEHDGLTYASTPIHRVIDEFMVQGGDIEKGDGTGTVSIYGREFADEELGWRHIDAKGLVCSANRGRDTNGSQFFITLEAAPHLNGKHTVFGRLVAGEDTLERIAEEQVDSNDRPLNPILISRCGELERRKKAIQSQKDAPLQHASSNERGRRRRSASNDVEMENSPVPPTRPPKHRRTSDNTVDEGIRGRPRQRSGSRSPSRPLSTPSEDEENMASDHSSPAEKHKRKRSASPSRGADGTGKYERRRRSLPNQYDDGRAARRTSTEDEERYRPSPRRDGYRARGGRRGDDRYRPRQQDRGRRDDDRGRDDGRLGGGGGYGDQEPAVKFKGRGVMKYRDSGHAW